MEVTPVTLRVTSVTPIGGYPNNSARCLGTKISARCPGTCQLFTIQKSFQAFIVDILDF